MARCWSCGGTVQSRSFNCNSCKQLFAHEATRSEIRRTGHDTRARLADLDRTLRSGLGELAEATASGLSSIASAIEWGFNGVVWQLQTQHETLRSIDRTLKAPAETQANEWRQIADELITRGVASEADTFYTKSLASNPLDYRTYAGLAQACLTRNDFDRAMEILNRSLPHAPSTPTFHWKSHSYRLIGRIHACSEDYREAAAALRLALDLSPGFAEGHYDFAQYKARTSDSKPVAESLSIAMKRIPTYWRLAASERNFDGIRPTVDGVRTELLEHTRVNYQRALAAARQAIASASRAVEAVQKNNAQVARLEKLPQPVTTLKEARDLLESAAGKSKGDYIDCLEGAELLEQATTIAVRARDAARAQRSQQVEQLNRARDEVEDRKKSLLGNWLASSSGAAVIVWMVSSFVTCAGRLDDVTNRNASYLWPFSAFVTVGILYALGAAAIVAVIGFLYTASIDTPPAGSDGE